MLSSAVHALAQAYMYTVTLYSLDEMCGYNDNVQVRACVPQVNVDGQDLCDRPRKWPRGVA
jgi:hypothetical protein